MLKSAFPWHLLQYSSIRIFSDLMFFCCLIIIYVFIFKVVSNFGLKLMTRRSRPELKSSQVLNPLSHPGDPELRFRCLPWNMGRLRASAGLEPPAPLCPLFLVGTVLLRIMRSSSIEPGLVRRAGSAVSPGPRPVSLTGYDCGHGISGGQGHGARRQSRGL